MDLVLLSKIAIRAARDAGKIIHKHMFDASTIKTKRSGSSYATQVVTTVDIACEAAILGTLLPSCNKYGIALLSEETADDGGRFNKTHFWCIDPMDGTLAFINKQPGFSVSIALVAKDGTPIIGVVYNPRTGTLYHAIRGAGAYKNDHPWIIKHSSNELKYLTDKKLKETPRVAEIKSTLNTIVTQFGLSGVKEISGAGAVMNAILVLENGPACMLKLPKKEEGGGSIWDYAATACIYQELGLQATNYEGGPLDLNRKDSPFMNHEGVYFANLTLG